MRKMRCLLVGGLAAGVVTLASGAAHAEDISGVIVRTMVLSETSRLVGDVTCRVTGAACIAFGAPNIALNLNGFTITGPNVRPPGARAPVWGPRAELARTDRAVSAFVDLVSFSVFEGTAFCSWGALGAGCKV